MPKPRDYKREYRLYHSSPLQIRARVERKRARKKMGLKTGDPREVDHEVPLSRGGTNHRRNLSIKSRGANRAKGAR
tara:strand:+ start:263 stop:490 length:228 start_codon:yes stop_codon:yes gene_type:complete